MGTVMRFGRSERAGRGLGSVGVLFAVGAFALGCSDPGESGDAGSGGRAGCAQPLPIEGHPDGPRSDELYLECTPDYLNASGILSDPQDDMGNVRQRIAVFSDLDCSGPAFEVDDDVINDRYEDFSIVLEREKEPELHAAICDSGVEVWPVEVTFGDEAGHVTSGRVLARVVILYRADDL